MWHTHARARRWEEPTHMRDTHARTYATHMRATHYRLSPWLRQDLLQSEIRQASQWRELIITWRTHLKSRDTKSLASRWQGGTLCMS